MDSHNSVWVKNHSEFHPKNNLGVTMHSIKHTCRSMRRWLATQRHRGKRAADAFLKAATEQAERLRYQRTLQVIERGMAMTDDNDGDSVQSALLVLCQNLTGNLGTTAGQQQRAGAA